jgi:hypothetical protein
MVSSHILPLLTRKQPLGWLVYLLMRLVWSGFGSAVAGLDCVVCGYSIGTTPEPSD